MYDLKSKSIFITGGGSGIGREACLLAAKSGARVTVADIAIDGGQETAAMIKRDGGEAQFVRCDVIEETDVKSAVAFAIRSFGRLDGAFNNAGIAQRSKLLHEVSVEECLNCLQINVVGVFLCMKYEIIAFLETGKGAIVNTASIAGTIAYPNAAEYIASKHGVLGLTKSASLDYSSRGIRTNAVLPAATLTPMIQEAFAGNDKPPSATCRSCRGGRLASFRSGFIHYGKLYSR
jgi:NAD(P)-dependent dehydrogenase (short-subunit alcohol dehydrogenase family)